VIRLSRSALIELRIVCIFLNDRIESFLACAVATDNCNRTKERVMKLQIIGAAMALTLAAGPAMARHVYAHPGHPAISTYCATIQPGNPFSLAYDYVAWSKWRQRGGWDSRGDDACFHNPLYSPPGTPTFVPVPFGYF
jgi:hypothetical protein